MFSGCIPTLVTPFHQQRIDARQFHELIEWHLNYECPALCIGGITGEVYSLDIEEQEKLFQLTAQSIRRRVPFIVNIVDASTRKAIWLTQAAEAAGASAVIHRLFPYHANPIPQLIHHCHFIQQNTVLPIFVECDLMMLSDMDIIQLAAMPQVKGIIDIGHHMIMLDRVLQEIDTDFAIFCGNDLNIMSHLINGTQGYFSGLANILPKELPRMIKLAQDGEFNKAKVLYQALVPLQQNLVEGGVPASLKYLLANMQLCQEEVQLPLMMMTDRQGKVLQKHWKEVKEVCQTWNG